LQQAGQMSLNIEGRDTLEKFAVIDLTDTLIHSRGDVVRLIDLREVTCN